MAQHVLKVTFTRGELSPLAHARQDIQIYAQSAAELLNFMVLKEGGVRRRSGTRYRGATKFPDKATRFLDFVFNSTQAYAIEFGHSYCRWWVPGGGQIAAGLVPYEIVSPYAETDLAALSWVTTGDEMFIAKTSNTIPPKTLRRLGHANWSFLDFNFVDGPYLPINDQQNSLTTSAVLTSATTVTFTWTNALGLNNGVGLLSTDVGRHIRAQFGGKWSWGTIASIVSPTSCTVAIVEGNAGGGAGSGAGSLGGSSTLTTESDTATREIGASNVNAFASLSWRLGAFSQTTGYPGAVAFYQGRVIWGRTVNNPKAVFYSRSGLPHTYSPSDVDGTVVASHGGMLDITGTRSDEILWLQEAPRLQIGTPGAIRTLGASNTDDDFGPRNVSQRLEIAQGVSSVRPEVVGPSTVHAGKYGTSINDLYYDFQANSIVAPDISVSSDHIFDSGIRELTYQQERHRTLWSVLFDGTFGATTIDRYEKIIGFSRQELPGGDVQSARSIPGLTRDELFMIVRRTVNGAQVQYVETMDPLFQRIPLADAYFCDCGSTYSGALTNTVSGITWLEGVEVAILADGAVLPKATIVGGVLTLPNNRKAAKISFGIPYQSRGKLLRAPIQAKDGAALGRRTRVVDVYADVYETSGLKFVSDRGEVDTLLFRTPQVPMNTPPPPSTGTFKVMIDGSWESNGEVTFIVDDPVPATVRALNIHLDSEP